MTEIFHVLPPFDKETLDNLPFGVYIIDSEGTLEYVNKAMIKISGVDNERLLLGQNIFEIPTYSEYGLTDYIEKGIKGEPFKIEGIKYISYVGKKKSIRSYFGIPIKNKNGKVEKLLCLIDDITPQRSLEKQIREALKERNVLLREINHRVKNNMQIIYSIINLQSLKIKDRQALALIEESKNQIKSMLAVHERLYKSRDLSRINFQEYINELVSRLFDLFWVDKTQIKKIIEAEDIYLSVDKAIPCALIINELISNAIKYAFPGKRKGKIKVIFKRADASDYQLTVSDNGVGMPTVKNKKIIESLGLELVDSLVKQIYGQLKIKSVHGTTFTINFPENL